MASSGAPRAAESKKRPREIEGEEWISQVLWDSGLAREVLHPMLGPTWKAMLMEAIYVPPKSRRYANRIKWKDAVKSIPLLEWFISHVGRLDRKTGYLVAAQGNLDVVKFAHEKKCPWDQYTCQNAADGGHLEVIKFLREKGCPWNEATCYHAAEGGHLHVLKWAHENGCPWNAETCRWGAWKGHLDVIKYAHDNGCPWNAGTCRDAAWGGHLHVLKYAHENGCPWDEDTCWSASRGGYLGVLKYARENGCEWHKWTCLRAAAEMGHFKVVEWIRTHAATIEAQEHALVLGLEPQSGETQIATGGTTEARLRWEEERRREADYLAMVLDRRDEDGS